MSANFLWQSKCTNIFFPASTTSCSSVARLNILCSLLSRSKVSYPIFLITVGAFVNFSLHKTQISLAADDFIMLVKDSNKLVYDRLSIVTQFAHGHSNQMSKFLLLSQTATNGKVWFVFNFVKLTILTFFKAKDSAKQVMTTKLKIFIRQHLSSKFCCHNNVNNNNNNFFLSLIFKLLETVLSYWILT